MYRRLCRTRIEHKLPRCWSVPRSKTKKHVRSRSLTKAVRRHTSLTGIEETPISTAKNQHALIQVVRSHKHRMAGVDKPEITAPSEHTLREGVVVWELDLGYVLSEFRIGH